AHASSALPQPTSGRTHRTPSFARFQKTAGCRHPQLPQHDIAKAFVHVTTGWRRKLSCRGSRWTRGARRSRLVQSRDNRFDWRIRQEQIVDRVVAGDPRKKVRDTHPLGIERETESPSFVADQPDVGIIYHRRGTALSEVNGQPSLARDTRPKIGERAVGKN